MNKNSKISIIVPVHNAAKYLVYCIDSILKQTYTEFELILVDDGSTDGSNLICKGQTDKRVKSLEQENKGVSAARNLGLEHATGDYITFIDADDWILPDMLERLLQFVIATDAELACCEYISCKEHEQPSQEPEQIEIKCYDKVSFIRERLLNGDTRCWSKLYSKELTQDVRFPETVTIGEDLLFLTELLPKLDKVVHMTYKGYCYFNNNNGAMLSQFKPSYMDQIICWKHAKDKIEIIDPKQKEKVGGKLLMAIMLVIGKLSIVKDKEHDAEYLIQCQRELKDACKIRGAKHYVDKGYRIKITFFRAFPKLYMTLYGIWKH